MSQLQIVLRPPNKDDLNYIYDTWLRSLRETKMHKINRLFHSQADRVKAERLISDYYYIQKNIINMLLGKSLVTIACNPDDWNHIYGYCVYQLLGDLFVLHWSYVKLTYRRFHVFGRMLEELNTLDGPFAYTVLGPTGRFMKDKLNCVYKPDLIWR